jgi:hypothetical protein
MSVVGAALAWAGCDYAGQSPSGLPAKRGAPATRSPTLALPAWRLARLWPLPRIQRMPGDARVLGRPAAALAAAPHPAGVGGTHLYGRRLVVEYAKEEEGLDDVRAKTAERFKRGAEAEEAAAGDGGGVFKRRKL